MKVTKVGIAGLGAIGGAVARALMGGDIPGYELAAAANLNPVPGLNIPLMGFETLAKNCDLIVECLPPAVVPDLTRPVFDAGKDLVLITSSALLIHRDILMQHKRSKSRIIVPSGALVALDGVSAMAQMGIKSAVIATIKPPVGYFGAPYIVENGIDVTAIETKTLLFSGNALEAAAGFPANVNVAATLSLAGTGPENTRVEIWADPAATTNAHEIAVETEYSRLTARIENRPDPANPKTSVLAAQSIIATLKGMTAPLVVL